MPGVVVFGGVSGVRGNLVPIVKAKPKPKVWTSTATGIRESRKPQPGELVALWEDAQLAFKRGELLAERERIDAQLAELGLYALPNQWSNAPRWSHRNDAVVQYIGVHGFRDGNGNILSAEHDFISRATQFFDVTDEDLARVLRPNAEANEAQWEAAKTWVRQKKTELRKRKIFVR